MVAVISVFAVIISIVVFCVETLEQFDNSPHAALSEQGSIRVHQFSELDFRDPFYLTETVCSIWFTVEYCVRLAAAPNKFAFSKALLNVVDLLAIFPYFFTLASSLSAQASIHESEGDPMVRNIFSLLYLVSSFQSYSPSCVLITT